jgi:hypothetical protein
MFDRIPSINSLGIHFLSKPNNSSVTGTSSHSAEIRTTLQSPMTITRGVTEFWTSELHKVRAAEGEVRKFEDLMTTRGHNLLNNRVRNVLTYSSGMRIFGFSADSPILDDFSIVNTFITEALGQSETTTVRSVILSWVDDLMQQAYNKALACIDVVPFDGNCTENVNFLNLSTVPLTMTACFPILYEWGVSTNKKRKLEEEYSSPVKTSCPSAPRKSLPPYQKTSDNYVSPLPNSTKNKIPRAPKKSNVKPKKVVRVLLWGDDGGVDGYGGGI